MVQLGFERTKLRFGGTPEWCYARGSKTERTQQIVVDGCGFAAKARPTGDGSRPTTRLDPTSRKDQDDIPF
jgi:hypothetical protein